MLNLKKYWHGLTILDKYVLKQITEMFVLGVLIFTGIIFASDTFLTLIKQVNIHGIPFHVAFMIILLNLPSIIVMAIPMSMLLSTVTTVNKLCLASEITALRACSIGINRISKPILLMALILSIVAFAVNETIVPITSSQSKTLGMWALGQKNVPNGKYNFILKDIDKTNKLKRLLFVDKCENDTLYNIVLLDVSSPSKMQLSYSRTGKVVPEGWALQRGVTNNISKNDSTQHQVLFEETVADFGLDLKDNINKQQIKEYNIIALHKFLEDSKKKKNLDEQTKKDNLAYQIMYYDKYAFPLTTFLLVLLGIPLAITPPRVRYNRGLLFSILILFFFYLLRALSQSFGGSGKIPPFLAVWIPNIILFVSGYLLYKRKVYKIT